MDDCDRCGKRRELFHNEASGLAVCEDCDLALNERSPKGYTRAEFEQALEVISSMIDEYFAFQAAARIA